MHVPSVFPFCTAINLDLIISNGDAKRVDVKMGVSPYRGYHHHEMIKRFLK